MFDIFKKEMCVVMILISNCIIVDIKLDVLVDLSKF